MTRASTDVARPGPSAGAVNEATRRTTVVLGVTYAIAGAHHGFFELLQGNRATGGIGIASIGPEHVMWEYGTDDAITLLPTFLSTGLAALAVSLAIVLWCFFRLHRPWGRTGFLILFVALTLVGGGIGHIPFFLTAWAYATRMDRPLAGWRRILRGGVRWRLARAWSPVLAASALCFLVGLEISVTGFVPGASDPDTILAVCWGFLLGSLVLANGAYAGAAARDLDARRSPLLDPVATAAG